jgi:hypothetical protein
MVKEGAKKTLEEDEVWQLDSENTSEHIWAKLAPVWLEEQKKAK